MSDDEACLNNVAQAARRSIAAPSPYDYEGTEVAYMRPADETALLIDASTKAADNADDDIDNDDNDANSSSSSSSESTTPKRHKLDDNNLLAADDGALVVTPAAAAAAAAAPAPAATGGGVSNSGNSNVVASHYNTLEEKGLAERSKSRIFHMRNFNNWIKSMLINEFITRIRDASKLGAPLRVLDMCCGKGGDLYKWEKAHITHLICTDIAAISVEQCESRYRTLIERHNNSNAAGAGKFFSAEFFACDSTRVRLRNQYKDPSIELNLVSCQFAFHYCFESLQQAECMVKNAAECLRTGGYFIGTIPDAYEIVRRQRVGGGTAFGNDLYEVSFMCDAEEPPLFGGKYNFRLQGVVDCPEFLVHFPLLVKIARKFGLQLVMKESFGGYFRRMIESCKWIGELMHIICSITTLLLIQCCLFAAKGLMEKMQGLQTYPTHEHQQHNQSPELRAQFAHAAEYLATKDGPERHKKCATLSKAEWEATCKCIQYIYIYIYSALLH